MNKMETLCSWHCNTPTMVCAHGGLLLAVYTLCSSRMQLRTCRHASTPSSSRGRWRGKSTMQKREESGRAKVNAGCSSCGSTSTSTRRCPATGTGERRRRYTHDSISRRSASGGLPFSFSSEDRAPVNMRHMVSLMMEREKGGREKERERIRIRIRPIYHIRDLIMAVSDSRNRQFRLQIILI